MDFCKWDREDISKHHAAALSFLKSISGPDPSELKPKRHNKALGKHSRLKNDQQQTQSLNEGTHSNISHKKHTCYSTSSAMLEKDANEKSVIQKYVENTQKKKLMSISKESYSDNLFLLQYRAGELYDSEISYGHMIAKHNFDTVDSSRDIPSMALVCKPVQSLVLSANTNNYGNAFKPWDHPTCMKKSNFSMPNVKSHSSNQPNVFESDSLVKCQFYIPDYASNHLSPKKFFKNEMYAFEGMLAELRNHRLQTNQKDIIALKSLTTFPRSDLLKYSEDFFERLHAYSTNISSFLHNSHKFEKEMKKKINEEFRNQFPLVNITLTKFLSLKREMKKVVISECKMDPIILAYAYNYFDKLVGAGWATKHNRKICAALSITFAAKLHDIKGENLSDLFEELENTFRLDKKEMLIYEMPCLIALEFSLHLPQTKILMHYDKIISQLDSLSSSK